MIKLKIKRVVAGLILTLVCMNSRAEEKDTSNGAAVVIDVRTEAEWKEGHLEGAILIPHERIGESISSAVTDKKTRIYLYCRSGRRTGIALDVLKKAGYEDIINLGPVENASKVLNRTVIK